MTDLSTLSPEEKNVRLAELVGWRFVRKERDDERMVTPDGKYSSTKCVPKFTSSLDAVAAVEATLSKKQRAKYCHALARVVFGPDGVTTFPPMFEVIAAKPTQRTEALIKTLEAK